MIDIDKPKAYLGKAYRIDLQIASKEEQIRMWESLAEKVTAGTNGIGNTGAGNRTEEYAIKIADAKAYIEQRLRELVDVKMEATQLLNSMINPMHKVILEQRYLIGRKWEDVAVFMGYNVDYIKKVLYYKALDEFSGVLKKATKSH